MQASPHRLLLNAEPFGFGPSAAIAAFFPHLRPHFEKVGYLGKKHTLDLQRTLPYDEIHDVTGTPKEDRREIYDRVFAGYDILLTAMDHKVASYARNAGLTVYYYDALAWYWPDIPQNVREADLYLAQDFFGVRDRLKTVFAQHAAAYVVPPITPAVTPLPASERSHVLVNLGGLQNPFWPVDDVTHYARAIVGALRRAIPRGHNVVIAGPEAVAKRLPDLGIRTFPRRDMESVLAKSEMAFMTPGLGNIYDAAAFGIPTVWIPPANDSQGRQLDLIAASGMCDARIDWHDLGAHERIDYADSQPDVLARIAALSTRMVDDPGMLKALEGSASKAFAKLAGTHGSKTSALLQAFGRNGETAVAARVIAHARSLAPRMALHG